MNFATLETSAPARRVVLAASAAMLLVAAFAVWQGRAAAPAIPAVLPTLTGCMIVADFMSAYVLFAEFNRTRLPWLLAIAAGYALTALVAVPYILTFPAVFAPHGLFGPSEQTSVHLWTVWHLAFPSLVVVAVTVGRLPSEHIVSRAAARSAITMTIIACIVAASLVPVLLISLDSRLPLMLNDGHFTPAVRLVVLPAIMFVDVVALIVLYARTRNRIRIAMWLFIALLASSLDALMALVGERYAIVWYVGKLFMMLASAVMLSAFIGEITHLQARLTAALDDLRRARERERHLAQERLDRLASIDALTGLSNRTHLEEQLRARSASGDGHPAFAVLFISLDGSKTVNEQFGHAAGDHVLTEAAVRLGDAVRRTDTVARFSGDEFVVVARSLSAADDAEALAEDLLSALRAPYEIGEASITVAASIGNAL